MLVSLADIPRLEGRAYVVLDKSERHILAVTLDLGETIAELHEGSLHVVLELVFSHSRHQTKDVQS